MVLSIQDLLCPTLVAGIFAFGIAVLNLKALPLAHTIRLLPSVYRIFKPRFFPSARSDGKSESPARLADVFRRHTTCSRAVLLDLDINIHKSNSTFFADADINRAQLFSSLFAQALVDVSSSPTVVASNPKGKNLPAASLILAGVQGRFLREIRPYQSYDVISQIICWDESSLWFVTFFVQPGTKLVGKKEQAVGVSEVLADERLRKKTFAVLVSKYVVRSGRTKVRPADLIQVAGLGGNAEAVEAAKAAGLEYVKGCML